MSSRVKDSRKGKRLYQITDEEVARCTGTYKNPPSIIPHVRARRENTRCKLDLCTGEMTCEFLARPPKLECRQPWCPYAAEMRTRLLERLRQKYAPEGNLKGEL